MPPIASRTEADHKADIERVDAENKDRAAKAVAATVNTTPTDSGHVGLAPNDPPLEVADPKGYVEQKNASLQRQHPVSQKNAAAAEKAAKEKGKDEGKATAQGNKEAAAGVAPTEAATDSAAAPVTPAEIAAATGDAPEEDKEKADKKHGKGK